MLDIFAEVAVNITRVRERIAAAAHRAGRRPEEITLIAVTKRHPAEYVRAAQAAGITDVGENYVQEALLKQAEVAGAGLHWHLIGHLQTNKAKPAVSAFHLIQSLDSVKLAQALARQAVLQGITQAVLLQVQLGDEATKSGVVPEQALDSAAEIAGMDGLDLQGLMGIAPGEGDPRPYFAALRRLYDALPPAHRRTLSLGMTGDFEAAIAEGSTMIRLGTAIFGQRQ